MKISPVNRIFELNAFAFRKNLEGINQQTSINQMPSLANTINWIAGHVVLNRDRILQLLGQDKKCKEAYQVYTRGTTIFNTDKAQDIEEIKELFESQQHIILAAFQSLDARREEQAEIIYKLSGFGFHEAYHIGQLGYGRRLVGKKGAIQ